jgi:hypothetical protein
MKIQSRPAAAYMRGVSADRNWLALHPSATPPASSIFLVSLIFMDSHLAIDSLTG